MEITSWQLAINSFVISVLSLDLQVDFIECKWGNHRGNSDFTWYRRLPTDFCSDSGALPFLMPWRYSLNPKRLSIADWFSTVGSIQRLQNGNWSDFIGCQLCYYRATLGIHERRTCSAHRTHSPLLIDLVAIANLELNAIDLTFTVAQHTILDFGWCTGCTQII